MFENLNIKIIKTLIKKILKLFNIDPLDLLNRLFIKSLKISIVEQGISEIYKKLEEIVPDIKDQYSSFKLDSEYLITNVRGIHSFQVSLINEAIKLSFSKKILTIVDIGDSAGTHIQYIKEIHKDKQIKSLSVNLDENAVNKIRAKGLDAILARAEDLKQHSINADIFLSFEMLEHLINPLEFLHNLSENTNSDFLVITVPYIKESRVALHHIRNNTKKIFTAENTHIFEFSPEDWNLIFKHSGWKVVEEKIYYQYPKRGIWKFTRHLWKLYDYEGFYGVVLKRDNTWSSLYKDW